MTNGTESADGRGSWVSFFCYGVTQGHETMEGTSPPPGCFACHQTRVPAIGYHSRAYCPTGHEAGSTHVIGSSRCW